MLLPWLTCGVAVMVASQHPAELPAQPEQAPDAPPAAAIAQVPAASTGLPAHVQDQLIAMQARTVARVQSDTGPFEISVGGLVVGQQLVVEDDQVPVLGRAQVPLEWPEFYKRVGRPDLAKASARRALVKAGMFVGGLVLELGSGLFLTVGMALGMAIIFWSVRDGQAPSPGSTNLQLLAGVGLILAGAAAMTVGILTGSTVLWLATVFSTEVATPLENLAMMDAHNAKVLAAAAVEP
jgi:hypothetical protein